MDRDILQNIPEDVKDFTQETGVERIQQTQEEVDKLEREMDERKRNIEEKIAELKRNIEEKAISLSQALDTQNDLDVELTAKEVVTLGKIINIVQIRELKNQMQITGEKIEEIQKEFDSVVSALEEAENELNDRHELDEIERLMSSFAQTETELWKEHQERLKVRDVREISRENNVLFIHNFADLTSGGLTVFEDRKNMSFDSRVNSLLGLSPDLSTSTIRLGHTDEYGVGDELWNSKARGFILKGGSVINAGFGDKSTSSNGLEKTRDVEFFEGKPETIRMEIRKAINKEFDNVNKEDPGYKEKFGYNELVVHNPEIGGFVIEINKKQEPFVGSDDTRKITLSMGIPLYGRCGADIFKIDYDETGDVFVPGEKVSAEDIQNNGFQLSEEQKRQKRQEIFDDCPFRLKNPEKIGTNLWKKGADLYEMTGDTQQMQEISSQSVFNIHEKVGNVDIEMDLFSDRVTCIESFAKVFEKNKYNHDKRFNELCVDIERNVYNEKRYVENSIRVSGEDMNRYNKGVEFARDKGDKDTESLFSNELEKAQIKLKQKQEELQDLLEKERDLLEEIENRKKELEQESEDESRERRKKGIENNEPVLWSLYGFAEAARQAGDMNVYEKAMELARSNDFDGNEDKVREVLERRLGPNPNNKSSFHITEKDLKNIFSSSVL